MKTRTNVKVIPSPGTYRKICQLADNYHLPYQDFMTCPHSTILYSRDVVDVQNITLPTFQFPLIGKNARFEFFDTKEDGTVLVIEFDCENAENCFKYLKRKYNLTTRYDNYRAHITLQKNIQNKNIPLPEITFDLLFDKLETDNGETIHKTYFATFQS